MREIDMKKWEYLIVSNYTSNLAKYRILSTGKIEHIDVLDDEEHIKVFNRLGQQGWEMISHVIHENWNQRYIFKREAPK